MISAVAFTRTSDLVCVGSGGLHLWRKQGEYRTLATECQGRVLIFNDMRADARGRLYAGTYYWGPNWMEKTGHLYVIGGDAVPRVVDEGIELSNGLGFSSDNRTLYFADSTARKIYAY